MSTKRAASGSLERVADSATSKSKSTIPPEMLHEFDSSPVQFHGRLPSSSSPSLTSRARQYSSDGSEDEGEDDELEEEEDEDDDDDDDDDEVAGERDREMDIDDEMEEINSGDDGGDDGDEGDGDEGDGEGENERDDEGDGDGDGEEDEEEEEEDTGLSIPCGWDECDRILKSQKGLVKHLTTEHIRPGRGPYLCRWRGCTRTGTKSTSRHSLLTHIRSHTGEKPYQCPDPGCGRLFTRSDAMNKHLKAIHGPNAKRRANASRLSRLEDTDDLTTADKELARDEDLTDLIARLKAKDRLEYTPSTADEEGAMRYIQDSRPGSRRTRKGRGGRGRKRELSDTDEFDEGVGTMFPSKRDVVKQLYNPFNEPITILGRSRWQAKYLMAKAKLLLVAEENLMRREEYQFWLAQEEATTGIPAVDEGHRREPRARGGNGARGRDGGTNDGAGAGGGDGGIEGGGGDGGDGGDGDIDVGDGSIEVGDGGTEGGLDGNL